MLYLALALLVFLIPFAQGTVRTVNKHQQDK